jgi:alkylation response protein AidB-like acyl-CoA dehydrogenase
MVRKFTKTELHPIASELDKKGEFPKDIIRKLSELGFMGIIVPEAYGGSSLDAISYCIIIEEVSKSLASAGLILIAHNALVSHSIIKYGNEEQKKKWLPILSTGEIIGAFCLNEAKAGAVFSNIQTSAEPIDGGYVISGEKDFVVNAESASLFIVFTKCLKQGGNTDISAFIIEKSAPGIEIKKEEVLGMRTAGICNLRLNKVKVSNEDMLGKIGEGISIAENSISLANLGVSALGVGITQSSLDEALRYSKERRQFGRPICEFPLVQEMLIEMKKNVSQSRLLVYETAQKYDAGEDCQMDIALTKLCATESAMCSAIKAVQVHGGYGYTKDYPVERFFRDAKVSQVWGGTSITQQEIIAKKLLA